MPRFRTCIAANLLLAAIVGLASARPVVAQDFRVYTAVSEIGPDQQSRRIVARSLTIFHAGKVYDHMEEVGELVIFEPVQDRFVLLRDRLGTQVSLDELRNMLRAATTAAEKYAAELEPNRDPEVMKSRAQLLFQLRPEFQTRFDADARTLRLDGAEFSYDVAGGTAAAPELLTAYARYADWTARLNTVLHSRGSFPAPREALNGALLEHELLPVSVTLRARDPRELHLRADHEFRWQLQPIDRDLIHQWEQLAQSEQIDWVSFREYQHKLLAATRVSAR